MKITQNFILALLATTFILFSCKNNSYNSQLLRNAEALLETEPAQILILLDSIENPQSMDKNDYMRYVLVSLAAKKETQVDITADTTIFETLKYFKDIKDYKNYALANYYAGYVNHSNKKDTEAIESFMNLVYYKDKMDNKLLVARSFNNIGYIYYEKDLYDSAIVNYQKALPYFDLDKLKNTDQQKIITLTNIGSAYEASNNLDSAIVYYDKCLSLAKESNNKMYEFYALKNSAVVFYIKKDYNRAIEYFDKALVMDVASQINVTESSKIHLALLKIYNDQHNISSAKKYAELIFASIPEVTDPYTLKGMYSALADYHEQTGDYKKALEYRNLEKETKQVISEGSNPEALLQADKEFYLNQKDREAAQYRAQLYYVLITGAIVICIAIIFAFFIWRDRKKGKAEIKHQADRYDEMKDILTAMGNEYPAIEAEIKSMLEDD